LSLNDALAVPMYKAFFGGEEKPDDTPYTVIAPEQDIAAKNVAGSAVARMSKALPWNRLDAVPQAGSDKILWAALHRPSAPAPAAGPNASPLERERAAVALRMLAEHKDAARWLNEQPDP